MRRTVLQRAIAAVVLVLSTSVAALLPLADAHAERAANQPTAHVEATGSQTCAPAHDELTCQLCRSLRLASATEHGGLSLVLVSVASAAQPGQSALPQLARLSHATAPRAPPIG